MLKWCNTFLRKLGTFFQKLLSGRIRQKCFQHFSGFHTSWAHRACAWESSFDWAGVLTASPTHKWHRLIFVGSINQIWNTFACSSHVANMTTMADNYIEVETWRPHCTHITVNNIIGFFINERVKTQLTHVRLVNTTCTWRKNFLKSKVNCIVVRGVTVHRSYGSVRVRYKNSIVASSSFLIFIFAPLL